ncbi:MAG: hypothetical protein MUE42_09695 [Opitutaceae bacterium]|jgi:hypothetical protein|nr:hypothetical protein [Opitutaceae bacterium]
MITPHTTTGAGPTPGPDPRRVRAHVAHAPEARTETLSNERAVALRAALERTPVLRPEIVTRAKSLAVDPNYPPLEIIERVASQIAATQDLSEITE